jgi:hypothetical protein
MRRLLGELRRLLLLLLLLLGLSLSRRSLSANVSAVDAKLISPCLAVCPFCPWQLAKTPHGQQLSLLFVVCLSVAAIYETQNGVHTNNRNSLTALQLTVRASSQSRRIPPAQSGIQNKQLQARHHT